jgi:hypothetical protein
MQDATKFKVKFLYSTYSVVAYSNSPLSNTAASLLPSALPVHQLTSTCPPAYLYQCRTSGKRMGTFKALLCFGCVVAIVPVIIALSPSSSS